MANLLLFTPTSSNSLHFLAECLTVLAGEYDHVQVGDKILHEIAGKTFNVQDSKSLVHSRNSSSNPQSLLHAHKFPKQRFAITGAAIAVLADKGATVRKMATALLVKLLELHPYRTHKGMLQLDVWQAGYQDVYKELEKVEGKIGNAVEKPEGEEAGEGDDDDEDKNEEEGGEGEEGSFKKKKKKLKK